MNEMGSVISAAARAALNLTFRGLGLCDGCGARLEPGDRLSGLCSACSATLEKANREAAG